MPCGGVQATNPLTTGFFSDTEYTLGAALGLRPRAAPRVYSVSPKKPVVNLYMLLHVHKDLTDSLVVSDVATEFVSKSERRLQVFGKF